VVKDVKFMLCDTREICEISVTVAHELIKYRDLRAVAPVQKVIAHPRTREDNLPYLVWIHIERRDSHDKRRFWSICQADLGAAARQQRWLTLRRTRFSNWELEQLPNS
jgi:hypothetical protein